MTRDGQHVSEPNEIKVDAEAFADLETDEHIMGGDPSTGYADAYGGY